jgi:hypothetical protein
MRYVAIILPAWLALDVLLVAALAAVRRVCRRAYARRAAARLGPPVTTIPPDPRVDEILRARYG